MQHMGNNTRKIHENEKSTKPVHIYGYFINLGRLAEFSSCV